MYIWWIAEDKSVAVRAINSIDAMKQLRGQHWWDGAEKEFVHATTLDWGPDFRCKAIDGDRTWDID